MHRKLIQQRSAMTITLPISWVREHGLSPKDEVNVIREGNDLLITAGVKRPENSATVQLQSGDQEHVRISIENEYLRGLDTLMILGNESFGTQVYRVCRNLIGFEVADETPDGWLVKATAEPSRSEFSAMANRSISIVLHLHELLYEQLNSQENHSERIAELVENARRLLLCCTRTLHQARFVERDDESFVHLLLERLILIAHSAGHAVIKMGRNKPSNKALALMEKAITMFREWTSTTSTGTLHRWYYENYFERDLDGISGKADLEIFYHAHHTTKLVFLLSQPNILRIREKYFRS